MVIYLGTIRKKKYPSTNPSDCGHQETLRRYDSKSRGQIWDSHFWGVKPKTSNLTTSIWKSNQQILTIILDFILIHVLKSIVCGLIWVKKIIQKRETSLTCLSALYNLYYSICLVYVLNTTSVHMTDFEPYHVVPYSITTPSLEVV